MRLYHAACSILYVVRRSESCRFVGILYKVSGSGRRLTTVTTRAMAAAAPPAMIEVCLSACPSLPTSTCIFGSTAHTLLLPSSSTDVPNRFGRVEVLDEVGGAKNSLVSV